MIVLALVTELNNKYPDRATLLGDDRTILLAGSTASRTLLLEVGDDAVRISAGRIVHAEVYEEPADLPHVIEIIDAILEGAAEELYGSTGTGVVGFIGYRISNVSAPVVRMDEPSKVVHTAKL